MKTKTIPVTGQGVSVDLIRFRAYRGRYAEVSTAEILNLNPGLADLGPILPIGTKVTIPILEEARPTVGAAVTLWS